MFQLNNLAKLLLILFSGVIFYSCKPTYKTINKVNKTIKYNSKEEYCVKIKDKYNIETSHLVFIDSVQKNNFMNYIVNEKVAYIYGIVVNSKDKIDNNFIQENNSCYSRVTNLVKNNPELIGEKLSPTRILNFNYTNSKKIPVKLEGNKLLLIIFSTKLGTSIINDIKKIIDEFKTNERFKSYNYYLISID
jgi:hypothetical protein